MSSRPRALAVTMLVAACLASTPLAAQQVLDTVKLPAPTRQPNRPVWGGDRTWTIAGSDRVRVTLLSLDKDRYAPGDPVVYELLVENTSGRAVKVGASRDLTLAQLNGNFERARAERTCTPFVHSAYSRFGLWAPALDEGVWTPTAGADDAPGTLIELAPGASLRVRAQGAWQADANFPEGPVRVQGDVYLGDDQPTCRAAFSKNEIEVLLMPRREE
jgi:hypothetical protein